MNKFLLSLILSFLVLKLFSQVEVDSTLGKYGYHTIWTFEKQNFGKQTVGLDSSYSEFDAYNRLGSFGDFHQNLGSFLTANRSFSIQNEGFFKQLSYNPYSQFGFKGKENFYQTLSPYSTLHYTTSTHGDVVFNGLHTTNIKPNWNLGFQFKKNQSKRQYPVADNDKNLVNLAGLRLFTSFESFNKKYSLIADYSSLNYNTTELGGYDFGGLSVYYDAYFKHQSYGDGLLTANSRYEERNYFLRHQYKFDSSGTVSFFHQLDINSSKHKFLDNEISVLDSSYYSDNLISRNYGFSSWRQVAVKNQFGIKGKIKNMSATASLINRNYTYILNQDSNNVWKQELVLNGQLKYENGEKSLIVAEINQSQTGAFLYKFDYLTKKINASVSSVNSLPYMMYENFQSNFVRWKYDTLVNTQTINADLKASPFEFFNIGLKYNLINNFTYLDSNLIVYQSSAPKNLVNPFFELKFKIKKIEISSVTSGNIGDTKLLGLPELMNRTRITWQVNLFKKALKTVVGGEMKTYSKYTPYGYSPVVHQFYYQDKFYTPWYPNADVFVNFNIKRARVFIKGSNIFQPMMAWNFETAKYPVNFMNIAFGVDWKFFD